MCVCLHVSSLFLERIWHQKLRCSLQNALFDRTWHLLQGGGELPHHTSAEPCLVPVVSVPVSTQGHQQLPLALQCAPGMARTAEPDFSILPCQMGSGGYSVTFNTDRWRTREKSCSFAGSLLLQEK